MQVDLRHKAIMLLYATSWTALNLCSASRFSAHLPDVLLKLEDDVGCAAGILMLAILCIGYPCAVLRGSTTMRKIIKVSFSVLVLTVPLHSKFSKGLLSSFWPIHMPRAMSKGLMVHC